MKLAKQLNLKQSRCLLKVDAMNDSSTTANHFTELTINSIHSDFSKKLTFFIVPTITDMIPSDTIPREIMNIPPYIKLADPEFHKPAGIDMLLGSGPTLSIFCNGQISLPDNDDLILQKTKLGWIIGGGLNLFKNM